MAVEGGGRVGAEHGDGGFGHGMPGLNVEGQDSVLRVLDMDELGDAMEARFRRAVNEAPAALVFPAGDAICILPKKECTT